MKADAALETLTSMWARHGLSASAIRTKSDGTIVASDRTQLVDSAQTLLVDDSGEGAAVALSPEQLERLDLLGEGGMGQVHLARQASLRREVAVKTVRAGGAPRAGATLLKEAWVGGSLEHPNVVPVHTLARSERGAAVVMKRVEGVSWSEVIADPSAHERFAGERPLEAHLDVLEAVCHAVAFAHSRGILHLDLKPENVMIGAFGEVYVLDWGLAAGFGDEAPSWLVRTDDLEGLAGTPAYMAPELAAADGPTIGPRTDVYLLGGMLHTILTGRALHEGKDVIAILTRAFVSEAREYPVDVPLELVKIVHKATRADPKKRYATVTEFREAIEGFLKHRRADRLARTAADALAELAPLVAEGAGDVEVEPRVAEVELAIERARRGWPKHPQLAFLDAQLSQLRVGHAIAHERLEAAEAFAERLDEVPEDLAASLEQLRRRLAHRERHVRRLESMSRELDFTLGSEARRRLFGVFGVLWLGVSLLLGWLTRSGIHPVGYPELLLEGVALVATLVPVGVVFRKTLFNNLANRRLYGGLIATACAVELHWVACMLLDVDPLVAVAVTALYYAYLFFTLAIVLDTRLWVGAASMIGAVIGVALLPDFVYEWLGLGGAAAVALILYRWRDGPWQRAEAP